MQMYSCGVSPCIDKPTNSCGINLPCFWFSSSEVCSALMGDTADIGMWAEKWFEIIFLKNISLKNTC